MSVTLPSSSGIHVGIGTTHLPKGAPSDYIEFEPLPPLPKPDTVRKTQAGWKRAAILGIGLVPRFTESRGVPQLSTDALAWLRAVGEAAHISHVTFHTGHLTSTSQKHQEALLSMKQAIADQSRCTPVWQPAGTWQMDHVIRLCETNKLAFSYDPFMLNDDEQEMVTTHHNNSEIPLFLKVRTLGIQTRISDDRWEQLAQWISPWADRGIHVAIEGERAVKYAQKLLTQLTRPE